MYARRRNATSFDFDYWSDTPQLHQGTLQTLDTTTHQLAPTLPVGRFPLDVATSTDSTTAYVSNYKDNSITVIDLPTMTVTTTEQVGAGPHGLVYLDQAV